MIERPDDGHAVGLLRQLRQQSPELDAGQAGGERADHAAIIGGSVRLGIERFDVRRPALQPQPDDRRFLRRKLSLGRVGAGPQQSRQRKSRQTQAAHAEERASAESVPMVNVKRVNGPSARRAAFPLFHDRHPPLVFCEPSRGLLVEIRLAAGDADGYSGIR